MSKLNSFMGATGEGGFASSGYGMVAQAILGGLASSQEAKDKKKESQMSSRQRLNDMSYQAALADWYERRDKAEWRSASKDYQQFSNLSKFAPDYKPTYQPAALGAMPTAEGYIAGNNSKTNAANSAFQQKQAAATVGGNG